MNVCPCCYTSSTHGLPHDGQPCPTALALREAEIDEKIAHVELMKAQREATIQGARRRREQLV